MVAVTSSHIATIAIARPEKLNAFSEELIVSLRDEFLELSTRDDLRAVLLTGGETVFSAGADVNSLAGIDSSESAREFITTLHELCAAALECPVPVIAVIEGPCFGAGLELAASCDIRVAGHGASFAMPEVRIGMPSVIEAHLLPRIMGEGPAKAMLFHGGAISAKEAYQWGLVTTLTEKGKATEAALVIAKEIADCAPGAIRTQKQMMRQWETASYDEAIAHSIDAFAEAYANSDKGCEPTEGTSAWLEKRNPSWVEKK